MVEAPTPSPPINLKNANIQGSLAKADPIADTKYNTPIQNNVFFRPHRSVGNPPNIAPNTVPHNAEDTTINP